MLAFLCVVAVVLFRSFFLRFEFSLQHYSNLKQTKKATATTTEMLKGTKKGTIYMLKEKE